MAVAHHLEPPPGFIEEINFKEMDIKETIGKGAFGVVYEAEYRGIPVAVKMIESENERRAFITELRQLSRVSHPNIIRLYGACSAPVSIVMELAECGSLYNLLHGYGSLPHYNGGHAMSWCLQCAKGVEYLHDMKPKALIHRDLKPPNLLLTNQGLTLKICDFGTACDIHTQMTNNKGSAAWMAPEVFEGEDYSEKCDVFSWGIILWEVLTRRKPFDEIGGPAFRIMWAVHTGTRPPLIQGCPRPIEELMTKCWSKESSHRPSMHEVVNAMNELMPYFPGCDIALVFPDDDEDDDYQSEDGFSSNYGSTVSDTLRLTHITNPMATDRLPSSKSVPMIKKEESAGRSRSGSSSPALEAPLTGKFGAKRRSSSDLIAEIEKSPIDRKSPVTSRPASPAPARPRSSSTLPRSSTSSPLVTPMIQTPDQRATVSNVPPAQPLVVPLPQARDSPLLIHEAPGYDDYDYANDLKEPENSLSKAYLALDLQFQPLPPMTTSSESMEIYKKHCKLAEEYLKVQTEITLLNQRKDDLNAILEKKER